MSPFPPLFPFGEIKTTLQADVLRSKTPEGVRRELAAILLGHNLV